MDYDELVRELENGGSQTRCSGLRHLLEKAGFSIKQCNSPGHYVITHDHIKDFTTGSFNCGHGKNPVVKKPYIIKILNQIVRVYEDELREYLEEAR